MPTHKTKSTEIDAIKYTGTNDSAIETFVGVPQYFDDGAFWFPNESWAANTKVVWTTPVWRPVPVGSWIIKQDGVLNTVLSNEEFEGTYENV